MQRDRLGEVQSDSRALSRAHAAMVRDGLADLTLPTQALAWAADAVDGWKFDGHNRVRAGYRRLLAGTWMLSRGLPRIGLDPGSFLADASEVLREAADDQARRNGMRNGRQLARDPVQLWVKHFAAMVAGDPYFLADSKREGQSMSGETTHSYDYPAVPGHGPDVMGWRQVADKWSPAGRAALPVWVRGENAIGRPPWCDVVLRMPSNLFDRVHEEIGRRVRAQDGWGLPAPDEMRRKLADAGYLMAAGAKPDEVWAGEKGVRCLKFDLGRILDGEDQDDEDTPPRETTPVTFLAALDRGLPVAGSGMADCPCR